MTHVNTWVFCYFITCSIIRTNLPKKNGIKILSELLQFWILPFYITTTKPYLTKWGIIIIDKEEN
jgi:hypothetical protein